jgi:hypothetical protein
MTWSNKLAASYAAALFSVCLLSACGSSDSTSYLIDGTADHALSLFRDKPFFWSDSWNLELVVTSQPDCQRRHVLKRGPDGNFKLLVYRTGDGAFILKQGKRWYVTELSKCQLQQFPEPPPVPGELIGLFEAKGGPLHFSLATADNKGATEASPQEAAAPGAAR